MDDKEKCILDLFNLLHEVDQSTKCHSTRMFKTGSIGGCDIYQGMSPFQKEFTILKGKHYELISDIIRKGKQ